MKKVVGAAVAFAVVLSGCSMPLGSSDDGVSTQRTPATDVTLVQSNAAPPRSNVADVIERVLPSVVNVRVTSVTPSLFGPQRGRGEGSGVVISRDGIIVTNNHVVADATSVEVVFKGGKSMDGRVLGTDPQRDLAVIQVDANDLTPITLGHSSRPHLRLGDSVIAIGFPLGLGATVTKGIISAEKRNVRVGDPTVAGPSHLENLLQTDAAINPGNSGGALVNMRGQLVGINSAAASAASAENIGFAIAIDSALPVIQEILSKPPSERAWIGVFLTDLDPAFAAQFGIDPDVTGSLVTQVIPGSPARRAGLERGDVIVSVNGDAISSADDLTAAITQYDPGDTVELGVVDPDGRRTVEVTLVQRPAQF